jgi:hypothetical protein
MTTLRSLRRSLLKKYLTGPTPSEMSTTVVTSCSSFPQIMPERIHFRQTFKCTRWVRYEGDVGYVLHTLYGAGRRGYL